MKKCNRCKKEKVFSDFSWANKNQNKRSPRCKECQNILSKRHYEENSKEYVKYRHRLKDRNRRYVYEYLKKNPCIMCGEENVLVLDFDHRDRKSKRYNISSASQQRRLSIMKLQEEIDKCDVLCANCHRKKTALEMGAYKIQYIQEDFISTLKSIDQIWLIQ